MGQDKSKLQTQICKLLILIETIIKRRFVLKVIGFQHFDYYDFLTNKNKVLWLFAMPNTTPFHLCFITGIFI